MYRVKTTRLFDHRLKNLKNIFNLSDADTLEAVQDIKFTMKQLQRQEILPKEYDDHKLEDEPWIGFNEYHIFNDLLVVYYKVEKKKNIRFTTITNHSELRNGSL